MIDYSSNNKEESFIFFSDDQNPVYLENSADVIDDDVETNSLQKLGEILKLTEDEVLELLKQVGENNRDAINTIIVANLPLVKYCALPFKDKGLPWDDLIQEGSLALEEAVRKFDYKKGMFSTYASFKIRFAIIKALQEQTKIIKLPANVEKDTNQLKATENQLRHELGREPLLNEIAERMNISEKEVEKLLLLPQQISSLDEPVKDEKKDSGNLKVPVIIKDEKAVSPEKAAEQTILKDILNEMLKTLTIHEQRVIILRFGLENGHPMTLAEVGKELQVSGEAVRQTEARALRKLRGNSANNSNRKKLMDFLVD